MPLRKYRATRAEAERWTLLNTRVVVCAAGAAVRHSVRRSRRCGSERHSRRQCAAFERRFDRGRAPLRDREAWKRPDPSTVSFLGTGAHPAIRLQRVVPHPTAADAPTQGAIQTPSLSAVQISPAVERFAAILRPNRTGLFHFTARFPFIIQLSGRLPATAMREVRNYPG
jgi:hypothetical protein